MYFFLCMVVFVYFFVKILWFNDFGRRGESIFGIIVSVYIGNKIYFMFRYIVLLNMIVFRFCYNDIK